RRTVRGSFRSGGVARAPARESAPACRKATCAAEFVWCGSARVSAYQLGLSINAYCGGRSSRGVAHCSSVAMGHGLFSFGLLDVLLQVRLCRPHLREASAGFGLSRLATASMNN